MKLKNLKKRIIKPISMLAVTLLLASTIPVKATAQGYNQFNIYNVGNINMKSSCGLTTEELEQGLKHELKQYAEVFIVTEEKYNVNALLLASIASVESGHGRYMFEPNNIFGFNTNHVFRSVPECIDYVARKLRVWYLTDPDNIDLLPNEIEAWVEDENEIGQYFNGYNIYNVSVCYNEATDSSYGDYIVGMAHEIYYDSI